jgi:xanthine dehydrogenase accessory factor
MRDVLADVDNWRKQDEPIAIATVIETWGSAPRREGAKMALTPGGNISGSVSGGCVEGAVFEAGTGVLKSGQPELLHFGVADDTAWEVGLACGGKIEVFVEPLDPALYATVHAAILNEQPVATVTIVKGLQEQLGRKMVLHNGNQSGSLGGEYDDEALTIAKDALASGKSKRASLSASETESVEVFIDVILPSPTLIVVGGVHIAVALTALAKTLGYYTIVIDPRRAFGSKERFPNVDKLIKAWPDKTLSDIDITRSTAIAALTHDPKLDDPALQIALRSDAFYIGALGSNSTQSRRRKRLLEAGLTEEMLDRLHGPIGINLGGRTPEEIALSVMAEVVAARHNRTEIMVKEAQLAEAG